MAEHFQLPFQGFRFVKRKNGASQSVFVASSGSKLYSYAIESGQRLGVWPQDAPSTSTAEASHAPSNPENEEPPEKKRKVASSSEQTASGAPGKQTSVWSSIPILTSTPDGEYVVALTAEDKCIRVFQVEEDGSLEQLSARPMSKRPCALAFTDKNDILCGDKFGDVYCLPLIPSAEPRVVSRAPTQLRLAATPLTVHTQRNLKSLEMQIRQTSNNKATTKGSDEPSFEHDLILGHVSLLTDVAFVSLQSSTQKRSYILTADRDEHIRVSRGPPQAHVIENYCLGHTAFISKLCIPQWAPEYLVSGGGDPFLLVWNWTQGQLLHQIPLVHENQDTEEVVVRGIWALSLGTETSNRGRVILVALDGQPELQSFTLEPNGSLTPHEPLRVSGNILEVQGIQGTNKLVISVDCVHEPGSTQEWRSPASSSSSSSPSSTLLEVFYLKPGTEKLEWEVLTDPMVTTINSIGTSSIPVNIGGKERQELSSSLYSLENLRKKNFGEDE